MKKTVVLVMLITIFSKLFGFARDMTLAYFYGTSNVSDAYLISLTIPELIFASIASGIATGYIPIFSKVKKEFGEKEGIRFTNNLINLLLVLCTIIVLIALVFAEPIVRIFASGFKGETLTLTVKFAQVSIFAIYMTGLIHIFSGYLQLKGNYVVPALVAFPMNILLVVSIFLSNQFNIFILAIGTLIATLSQLFLLIPSLRKNGYRFRFELDLKDQYIKKMALLAMPVIIGVSMNSINVLIDRTLASQITEGGIAALNFATRLNGFVQGIFVVSISTVMYPLISKMALEKNVDGFKKMLGQSIVGIGFLVIPITIVFLIFTEQIIGLLLGRGAFDSDAVNLTSTALFFYSLGMLGLGLNQILSKSFYSLEDSKTPMINAGIAVVINIVLNVILSRYMGIGGLALATSIATTTSALLLFISLRRKIGSYGLKRIIISLIKILFASAFMGALSWYINKALNSSIHEALSLIISLAFGAILYLVIMFFMKVEDIEVLVARVKQKIKLKIKA
ncbi:murein biosynthesis integral membrane protein MurJ [Bacillus timonensis]|uniref:Probable lipid II flippase MurJ n=1 Tax=Bacillus timonensis TaxID=1033734 RepID=A0A4S3PIV5_9BACI|nr:murein biosynthesis integral membrane protein MurJ [Bacillus timonensis]THE09320.1 murein biosynthesis integral membrane protein MurJ [Bacillus timonensis]